MPEAKFQDSTHIIRVICDDAVTVDNNLVRGVAYSLEYMHSIVAFSLFRLTRDLINPDLYTYKFTLLDGRIWNQNLTFDITANPLMTFDVATGWRLTEFEPHRQVRASIIALRAGFPTLQKIICDYV